MIRSLPAFRLQRYLWWCICGLVAGLHRDSDRATWAKWVIRAKILYPLHPADYLDWMIDDVLRRHPGAVILHADARMGVCFVLPS